MTVANGQVAHPPQKKHAQMADLLLEMAAAVQTKWLAAEARIGGIVLRGLRVAPDLTRG